MNPGGSVKDRPALAIILDGERSGRLYPRDYWPDLCFLANWTGGTMGAYLRSYPDYFGERPVRDVGLIASEGRMTIPIEDNTPAGASIQPADGTTLQHNAPQS